MLYGRFFIWQGVEGLVGKEVLDLSILIYSVVVLTIVTSTIIIFFIVFQKRKNQLLIDKIIQKQKFEEELVKTQQEIQEETLKHIGRELHDNIGQMLVLATMQMNAVKNLVTDDVRSSVNQAALVLKESLEEVRALSKSLNNDVIYNLGFDTTVKNEVDRINRTGLLDSSLSITGEKVNFENKKDEVILFRILQEFFSNTLKYAEAEYLTVTLDYQKQYLNIKVEDDGLGFEIDAAEKGSGLINMEKRAELLNTEFRLDSELEKGTVLTLKYPYRTF